jgi:hypothetical protein
MKVAETLAGVWQSYLNISDLEMPQIIGHDIKSLLIFFTSYLFYVLLLTATSLGCRFLGLNTVTAYQRAKVYGLKIMNRGLNRGAGGQLGAALAAPDDLHTVSGRMTGDDATEDDSMPEEAAGIEPVPSQGRHEFKLGRKLSVPSQAIRSPSFL